MNKKTKKRLYNRRNKTLKRRKTMGGLYEHSVKIDLKKINDFVDVIPETQTYLIAYYDTDEEAGIDGYQEYIGIVKSKDVKKSTFKFIPYLSREYLYGKNTHVRDEYTRWKKGQNNQTFSFEDIDIYVFN